MTAVTTGFLTLERPLAWAVVLLLPATTVTAGSVSTALGDGFTDGWHTLRVRSVGFHGMAIVSVGVAVPASLAWRVEHRGGTWNTADERHHTDVKGRGGPDRRGRPPARPAHADHAPRQPDADDPPLRDRPDARRPPDHGVTSGTDAPDLTGP